MSCPPAMGLVRHLLENLQAKHSLPESWTSQAWGLTRRGGAPGLAPEPGQSRGPSGQNCSLVWPRLSPGS